MCTWKGCIALMFIIAFPLIAGTITKTITFSENDFVFNEVDGYDIVTLPGGGITHELGSPMLPKKTVTFLIPANAGVKKVEVINKKEKEIPGFYDIYPVQKPIPFSHPELREFIAPNVEVYSRTTPYPEMYIKTYPSGCKSGYHLAGIDIIPIHYIPVEKTLIMTTSITIRIEYTEQNHDPIYLSRLQRDFIASQIQTLVLNPEDVNIYAPPLRGDRGIDDVNYVIITTDALAVSFQPLADWRTKQGWMTEIKTTTWIYANYSGVDEQEKIRNFIKDYFLTKGLVYVFIGGDANLVPIRDAYLVLFGDSYIATDMYYSDLDGTWDANANGQYGELTGDGVDLYADVYVGRLCCASVANVTNYIDKAMTFEKNPPPDYLKKILLPSVMLFDQVNYHGRVISNAIADTTPVGWFDAKIEDPPNYEMRDSLNQGFQFCHPSAHGDPNGLYTNTSAPIFTINQIASLTNNTKYTIMNSIACYAGAFDDYECIAESLVNKYPGGCIATIMNTRFGWGDPPGFGPSEQLDITFYSLFFNQDNYVIGRCHSGSKDLHRNDILNDLVWRYCGVELTLFGEPALPMWENVPTVMAVNHPSTITIGNQSFQVSVLSGGNPVSGALVCCYKSNEIHEKDYTDASGNVTLNINPLTAGTMSITVTAKGKLPYEADIDVSELEGVYYYSLTVEDNDNNILNPGETADLYIEVKNYTSSSHTVTGIISTTDPYVTIITNTTSFGTIGPYETAVSTPPFTVSIDDNCPLLYSAPCTLFVNEGTTQWVSVFHLTMIGRTLVNSQPNPLVFDYRGRTLDLLRAGELDTMYYDDGTPAKSISYSSYHSFGVRFSPVSGCTLVGALVGRDPIVPYFPDQLYIRGDDNGLPGALLDSIRYNPDRWSDSGFTYIPFNNPLAFEEPFWLIPYDRGVNNGSILGDASGTGNSYATTDGITWRPVDDLPIGSTDLLIRALTSSFTAQAGTDTAMLYLENIGSEDVTVTDITIKAGSDWLYPVEPNSFVILPGNTIGVTIRIDTIDIPHTQNHTDTLVINSYTTYEGKSYYFVDYVPVIVLYQGSYPDVRYSSHTVLDTVVGNGDGFIDPGETIDMPVWVKNFGDSTASNVTGKFISHDQYITFSDSLALFGNIPAGDSAQSDVPFRFSISSSAPPGHVISCTLYTTDGNLNWTSQVDLKIGHGALISCSVDSIVFDYTGGKKLLNKNITKEILSTRTTVDTIAYDDGTPALNASTYSFYGVKFTPTQECEVKAVIAYVFSYATIPQTDTFYIRADNGGVPGTIIEKIPLTLTTIYGDWYYLPLSTAYVTSDDFWICGRRAALHSFTLDPADNSGRSYCSGNGITWTPLSGFPDGDLLLRAEVSYGAATASPIDTAFFWVKSTGAEDLIVDSISVYHGSGWITGVSPDNQFIVPPAESMYSYVVIDTTGLFPNQNYIDSLVFYGNAINQPYYLPVIIRNMLPIGLEESNMECYTFNFQIAPTIFNKNTHIHCSVPAAQHVSIKLYDVCGSLVKTILEDQVAAGNHTIILTEYDNQKRKLASGAYICIMQTETREFIRKVLLIN